MVVSRVHEIEGRWHPRLQAEALPPLGCLLHLLVIEGLEDSVLLIGRSRKLSPKDEWESVQEAHQISSHVGTHLVAHGLERG